VSSRHRDALARVASFHRLAALCVVVVLAACTSLQAAEPIRYRLSFPEPEHRWMQVEATFSELTQSPLELRMSRSSPGRYSLHDFAKNVYDVHVFTNDGRELPASRPDPYGWNVSGHGGAVTVKYKVFGDRVDGTYLAIDPTHAHINMPAAIMWAHGLDDRPATITFEQPAGMRWQVATQLHAGASPFEFSAPNLQYLMDSPAEFGPVAMRQFTVDGHTFRFSLHHTGTDAEMTAFTRDVEKIVRQEGAIFAEYPEYEPGTYTFLADYLPYASGDGMEHRNSTVMTSAASIASGRDGLLDTVAHEFFHCWNVERIRPKGLEPFDFDRANLSGELWLAEGFTQYYGPLVLQRAGLVDIASTARTLTQLVDTVTNDAGRRLRSAEDMSRMAPFIDGGRPVDRTNWSETVISYYTFGGAIATALDLTLRERSDGRVTLDDYMRAMWRTYGKPGAGREGYVDRPYTIADAEATLSEVSGDAAFARDFFAKYIQGHEVADYRRLLGRAGFVVRKQNPGVPWLGDLRVEPHGGAKVAKLVDPDWPVYAAGLEQDDIVERLDGQRVNTAGELNAVLWRHKPGDRVKFVFVGRSGRAREATITLVEDPSIEVVPVETTSGGSLSVAQRAFRERWLGSSGR
jgi:predicted metalloprotease with PDZ domain